VTFRSCLDLGCGTGVHLAGLADAGWSVVGVDGSADQLRLARQRARPATTLVQGDAARLPLLASSFALVISAFTHTDMEDFAALAAGARRVLAPDGCFIYVGLHPSHLRGGGRPWRPARLAGLHRAALTTERITVTPTVPRPPRTDEDGQHEAALGR
jgi:ubiquinone/menaquinone biosynthesis C-methylase UbiE